MGVSSPRANGDGSEPVSAEEILRVYRRILEVCRYCGLAPWDSEDVAQEIWAWLLEDRQLLLAPETSWISAVTRNFVLRHWRRALRHESREGFSLDLAKEPEAIPPDPDRLRTQVLDRMSANLPQTERRLLLMIRRGYTLVEAAEALSIPRGSRAYFKQRLIEYGRRELRRSRLTASASIDRIRIDRPRATAAARSSA